MPDKHMRSDDERGAFIGNIRGWLPWRCGGVACSDFIAALSWET